MPTRSIYLDAETEKLASEIVERTGSNLSQLFRDFLFQKQFVRDATGEMAVVQDCSILPMLIEDDPYSFDHWIDVSNTRRVLLMGVTMRDALVRNEALWVSLLRHGGQLHVLRQGDLENSESSTTRVLARMRLDDGTRLFQRRNESEQALGMIREQLTTEEQSRLVIRDSREQLLSYSAVVIWKIEPIGKVDVQIHPYFPGYDYNRGPRFILSTEENSRSFAALMKPITDLWRRCENGQRNG